VAFDQRVHGGKCMPAGHPPQLIHRG
jgi:hypothetical protein